MYTQFQDENFEFVRRHLIGLDIFVQSRGRYFKNKLESAVSFRSEILTRFWLLGYTWSELSRDWKVGWDTIKRFLLYWKIIRVDFPDACFCIISINCDSFVKTSNFINLRCTGNNHVVKLYKNFLTSKIMPKILNYFFSKLQDFKNLSQFLLVHWVDEL